MIANIISTQPSGTMQLGDQRPVTFRGETVGISIVENIEQSSIKGYDIYTMSVIADSDFVSDILKRERATMEVVRK